MDIELTNKDKADSLCEIINDGFFDYFYTCDRYNDYYVINTGECGVEPTMFTVDEMAQQYDEFVKEHDLTEYYN